MSWSRLLALTVLLFVDVARAQILQTATIVVDTTADGDARDGVVTLREAILLATGRLSTASLTVDELDNVAGSPGAISSDGIVFDASVFPAALPRTIELAGPLPSLNTGRDGIGAVDRGVRLDCAGGTFTAVPIASELNGVQGLEVVRCFVGVSVDGASNVVGGSGPGEGNVVVDGTIGIEVLEQARDTVIVGNFLGTDRELSAGRGNAGAGVSVRRDAEGTTIEGNVVGSNSSGISVVGRGSVVRGNAVGTDPAGEAALPNGSGIDVFGPDNQIGGPAEADRNLVSGNVNGVRLLQGARNRVQGNFIGTDATGRAALGNDTGIAVGGDAGSTLIGGIEPGEGNLISGNQFGIAMTRAGEVLGNRIGTDVDGVRPLGNEVAGVAIISSPVGIVIGRVGARNLIAFNGTGIAVAGGMLHRVAENVIHSNAALGIDLVAAQTFPLVLDGVTPNDAGDLDDGPNGLWNFPVLTGATLVRAALTQDTDVAGSCGVGALTLAVAGVYQGEPLAPVDVHLYANATCDPSGHGEGEVPLGMAASVATGVDGTVDLDFSVTLAELPGGFITTTATGLDGTSEFSACVEVTSTAVPAAACDDGNPCTEGLCDSLTGCVARPRDGFGVPGCDDGNPCNGEEACVAGACNALASLVCDDGDLCTADQCDASLGCTATPRLGFESVTCRLDTMDALLAAAVDVPPRRARKLGRRIRAVRKRVDAAARSERPRRERQKLAAAGRRLERLVRTIARLRSRGKLDPALLDALGAAAADATGRLGAIGQL